MSRRSQKSNRQTRQRAGAVRQAAAAQPVGLKTWQALLFGFIAGALIGGLSMAMFFILTREECQTVTITEPAQCEEPRLVIPPERPAKAGEAFHETLRNAEVILVDNPDDPVTPRGKYEHYLQAGAFRRLEDAEHQQQRITKLSISSYIESVEREAGGQWHRVKIGPYSSKREAERVKRQLWDKGRIEAARFQRKKQNR